jgi:hypothetical protein
MTIQLIDDIRVELNVAVFALGCLILIVGISRDLLNAKVPASAVVPLSIYTHAPAIATHHTYVQAKHPTTPQLGSMSTL